MINNSPRVQQAAQLVRMADQHTSQRQVAGPVVQRTVKIGKDTYAPGKRGFGKKHLETLIKNEAQAKAVNLRFAWKAAPVYYPDVTSCPLPQFTSGKPINPCMC